MRRAYFVNVVKHTAIKTLLVKNLSITTYNRNVCANIRPRSESIHIGYFFGPHQKSGHASIHSITGKCLHCLKILANIYRFSF